MADPVAHAGCLVDSNVILDIATEDETWFDWSAAALADQARVGALFVNPIVYAEVSLNYDRIEDLDTALPESLFTRAALPYQAGFLAARAFASYRARRDSRRSPLPDFYIGAHAAVGKLHLLTRDARRYRTYFPTVRLITPS